ncbi:unnamed protein product, partial [marine sediment metagenome]
GEVYVAYYDYNNNDLMYARSDDHGATWTTRRLSDSGGYYNSIQLSAGAGIAISYYGRNPNSLRYCLLPKNP